MQNFILEKNWLKLVHNNYLQWSKSIWFQDVYLVTVYNMETKGKSILNKWNRFPEARTMNTMYSFLLEPILFYFRNSINQVS